MLFLFLLADKTGYVLSRELKNLVRRIEFEYNRPTEEYKQPMPFKVSGIDDSTGERIAFDHVGNWPRSASPQRRHMENSQCPKRFNLERGKMYVQESPDLFCSDEAILEAMNASKGGTKIIHFVRNSFDMAMSNYFYHSQDPSPEKWGEFLLLRYKVAIYFMCRLRNLLTIYAR